MIVLLSHLLDVYLHYEPYSNLPHNTNNDLYVCVCVCVCVCRISSTLKLDRSILFTICFANQVQFRTGLSYSDHYINI